MIWSLLYSLKRLWRVKSRLLIMGFFLALGFSGWLTGESAQTSIKAYLAQNAKQILSADITVSVRRELKPDELKTLETLTQNQGQLAKGYEFFAMITAGEDTRLALVRVIDDSYPYYGELKLDSPFVAKDLRNGNLWAYEEFKSLIDLKLNQKIKLGDSEFSVSAFVSEDKTQTFRLASLAPRIFIHLSDLEKTNLIKFGSTFTTTYFLKANPETDVEDLAANLKKALPDPGVDISNYISLPDEESSPTQRLADFLGLTSLVTLLFSALSLFYLIQVWSLEQQKERALLSTFGVTRFQLFFVELVQSLFVALTSTLISVGVVLLLKPIIETGLKNWMNQSFDLAVGWQEILLILGSQFILLIALSNPFSKSSQNSTSQLLKNNFVTQQSGVLRFAPLFLLLWPYAILASQSLRNGTYFFGGLLFISLSLVFFGRISINFLSKLKWSSWKSSLAVKSLRRQSTASWAFLFTVGLSSSLLNLIPQIQSSVESLLKFDEVQSRPSLFMFDIQSEQWPDLQAYLNEKNIQPTATSPLVRARILKVNGENFERKETAGQFQSREEEESSRSRNRGVNITYRSYLQNGEKIVSGDEFPLTYNSQQKYAFVSIEKRYAGRIGVDIGDIITYDIQGIEIEAEVKNLREVKWSRFEPNFFVLMQDGLLNDAPQTILSSLPYLDSNVKNEAIKTLANRFPNISVIDVERLMESIVQNLEKIGGALRLMTYLTLLTGMMTIIFLLSAESQRRAFEIHLIKILGADSSSILTNRLTEVLILGSISVLVGVSTSFAIAYLVVDQVFQVSFTPNFLPAIGIILTVLAVCWAITSFSSRLQLKKQSYAFLKKEE